MFLVRYKIQFKAGLPEVYTNVESDVTKLQPIGVGELELPYDIDNPRCAMLYQPPLDRSGEQIDYWEYYYKDFAGGESEVFKPSGYGYYIVNINPVNDAPNEYPKLAKPQVRSFVNSDGPYHTFRVCQ